MHPPASGKQIFLSSGILLCRPQASRHASSLSSGSGSKAGERFELGPKLLVDLRSTLLGFVGGSINPGGGGEQLAKAQEGAVSALRAGTPVLFNDPAQLVGLLDVMLQKQSERRYVTDTLTNRRQVFLLIFPNAALSFMLLLFSCVQGQPKRGAVYGDAAILSLKTSCDMARADAGWP